MDQRLRKIYDGLYTGLDAKHLALGSVIDARKRARETVPPGDLSAAYRDSIRPYWRRYRVRTPREYWFRIYGADPRYIPDDLWFARIVPHFNNLLFAQALQDKCLHNLFVPAMARPRTVVKNVGGSFYTDDLTLLGEAEAISLCRNTGRILVKPSVGSGQGRSIRFYDSGTLTEEAVRDIFRLYRKNFIVQEKASQHPDLAVLNPDSLNTVRVVSFLWRDRVHLLSSILRIGGDGSEVDNVSRGGYQCTIRPDGSLELAAITKQGGRFVQTEQTAGGIRFSEVTVPSFHRVQEAVRSAAASMGHFRLLGWDIAVSPEGEPLLIEYNVIPGQNQSTCGPTFGDLSDDVLEDVFGLRQGR